MHCTALHVCTQPPQGVSGAETYPAGGAVSAASAPASDRAASARGEQAQPHALSPPHLPAGADEDAWARRRHALADRDANVDVDVDQRRRHTTELYQQPMGQI